MSLADRMHRLVPDLSASLLRFPIAALTAISLTVYANLDIASEITGGFETGNQVSLSGAGAFNAALAGHFFAQARKFERPIEALIAIFAAVIAGGLAFWDIQLRSSHLVLFRGLLALPV